MAPSGKFLSQTGNEKRSARTAVCGIARRFLTGIEFTSRPLMMMRGLSLHAKERITADRFRINRISLAPFEKSREWGSESLNFALRKP